MINIVIRETTSYKTVDEFKKVLANIVPAENITLARIEYDKTKGLPDYTCSIDDYPVILFTNIDVTIYLYALTAGYNGTGPNDLYEVLKLAGFTYVQRESITQDRNLVQLMYGK